MIWTKQWYQEIGSTNLLLKEEIRKGANEGLVILAKRQTDGRGRLGRSFFSPEGSGLYMSFLLRPRQATELCTRLTALSAVAVCRAIKKQTSLEAKIKWVNDVYLNEKKLCGILCQAAASSPDAPPDWMIVGIGVNLTEPQGGFPEEIRRIATALYPSHPHPEDLREALADQILEEFSALYPQEAWESAAEEYARLCFLPGRKVLVLQGGKQYPATVLGVNPDLSLRIQTAKGEEENLLSGEVSLQLQ